MKVAVVDHGMGNLRSVAKALEAAGGEVHVSADPAELRRAAALCIPGQGIFGRCMSNLAAEGLDELILGWIGDERPLLGICLGMQILFDRSEEDEATGLGVLAGEVRRLPDDVRVPHIGWNTVTGANDGAEHYYFDHTFAPHPADESIVTGWCEHGERFAASVTSGSIRAVQFHPEKSSDPGIALLKGWVRSL